MKPVIFDSEAEQELGEASDFYEAKRVDLGVDFENEV